MLADAGGTLTTANAKAALEALRDCAAEKWGGAASSELTISSGAVTPTGGTHSIDTESDAASDDLDTITTTNRDDGSLLLIYPNNAARTVVVKDESGGAGQIHTGDGNDFTMDETDKGILLQRRGSDWYEVARYYGTSLDDFRSYLGLGTAAVCATGVASGNVPAMDATGYPVADGSQITNLGAYMGDYVLVQDQKAQGTNGGTFTSGSWQTRTLNTKVVDETAGAAVTVSSNQITLPAGTYYVRIKCPAKGVGSHQARLHETTGTLSDIIGTSESSVQYNSTLLTTTDSLIVGTVTVSDANVTASQNIFEVQHRCSTTVASYGFGTDCNWTTEIYTTVELWRVE